MSTTIQPSKELTAGNPFIKWYKIKSGGVPIATNTIVHAALVDNIRPEQETQVLIEPKAMTWNPTGGKLGTGAWEIAFTESETAQVRSQPGTPTSRLKLSSAYLEIKVGGAYNFVRHDLITLGKGVI